MRRTDVLRTSAVVTVTAAALVLAGCSGDTDPDRARDGAEAPGSGQTVPEGPFTYTDARGKTVELDETPTTVVAQSSVAAALWDAGYKVDGVYGELTETDGELNYQAGNLELDGMEVLGKTYGEFNVQNYGLMEPDLLIDFSMDDKTLWYVPVEQAKQIFKLAPSIGVSGMGITDTEDAIETMVDLAVKLGADPDSEQLADDKAAYEQALEDVAEAAKGKEDLEILMVSRDPSTFYVANPEFFPEAQTLAKLGLNFVTPDGKPEFFHAKSWEEAADYADADVIWYDARELPEMAEKAEGIDTWTSLPAVRAGQVHEWRTAAPYSYRQYAELYQDVAEWLAESEPVD